MLLLLFDLVPNKLFLAEETDSLDHKLLLLRHFWLEFFKTELQSIRNGYKKA